MATHGGDERGEHCSAATHNSANFNIRTIVGVPFLGGFETAFAFAFVRGEGSSCLNFKLRKEIKRDTSDDIGHWPED